MVRTRCPNTQGKYGIFFLFSSRKKTRPHPEVYDIHQQLQENVLSHITLPRDISSSDIASGSSSRGPSPLFVRKNTSQLGINGDNELRPEAPAVKSLVISPSSLTKGFLSSLPKVNKSLNAGFDISVPKINLKPTNIVSKLKTGGAAVKMFTKETATRFSVSYSKRDEVDTVFAESVVHEPPRRRERQRTLSRDDSTIDDGSEVVEADIKEEVLLDSCGILATNTKQIFESPQYSFDDTENEQLKLVSKPHEDVETISSTQKSESMSEDIKVASEVIGDKTFSALSDSTVYAKADLKTDIVVNKESDNTADDDVTTAYLPRSNSVGSGFQCFCSKVENCPHNELDTPDNAEPVRHLREPHTVTASKSADENLGQKRVIDNSEADKILEKYSSKSKQTLTHPSLRISFSDSALATNEVNKSVDESPKAVLDMELEINTALQMKLPNLLQSSKMSRKSQRIYDSLKAHIQERLGDQGCQSTIIFI